MDNVEVGDGRNAGQESSFGKEIVTVDGALSLQKSGAKIDLGAMLETGYSPGGALGIVALMIAIMFIAVGAYFTWKLESEVYFPLFFLPVNFLGSIYVAQKRVWAEKDTKLNGLISGRFVIRCIYSWTVLAFTATGIYLSLQSWGDSWVSLLSLWCAVGSISWYAKTYLRYVSVRQCEYTDLTRPFSKGSARVSFILLSALILAAFFAEVCLTILSSPLNIVMLWLFMLSFAAVCFHCNMFISRFNELVPLDVDRGVKFS